MLRHVPEVLEELSLIDVPASVLPRCPQRRRQILQLAQVVRLRIHEGLIVLYLCLNEEIVIRVFIGIEIPIDEDTLEVCMPRPAGVQRVIRPLWKSIRSAHAEIDLADPALLQLPGLVDEHHVIFRALILPQVPFVCAVPERDRRPVREAKHFVRPVIFCEPGKFRCQLLDVVILQLLVCLSDDQDLNARIPERQQLRLCPHGPALSAAARAAIGDVPVFVLEKERLLRLRPPEIQRSHSLASSASHSSSTRGV